MRETVIFELEALALAICLSIFSTFVERRGAVVFTDIDGVLGSFIRGHSDNEVCASLIEYFGQREEDLENVCWLDRVPSGSNPADKPSKPLSAQFLFCSGGGVGSVLVPRVYVGAPPARSRRRSCFVGGAP